MKSANDACVTLAYRVAGSETAFVRLMNAKARSLGLDDTKFKNSRGRPVSGHYMSADDLARLSRYAMSNAKFRGLCKRQKAVIKWPGHAVRVESRNRLLNYDWANGIKTGATSQSGKCLLGSGKYDRRSLILVTLKQPTRDREEKDAVAMFKWGDAQYERRLIISAGDLVTTVPLRGGGVVRAVAKTSLTKTVRRAAQTQVRVSLLAAPPLGTMPEAGTKLGSIAYKSDGRNLGTVDLVADGLAQPSASPPPHPDATSSAPGMTVRQWTSSHHRGALIVRPCGTTPRIEGAAPVGMEAGLAGVGSAQEIPATAANRADRRTS